MCHYCLIPGSLEINLTYSTGLVKCTSKLIQRTKTVAIAFINCTAMNILTDNKQI